MYEVTFWLHMPNRERPHLAAANLFLAAALFTSHLAVATLYTQIERLLRLPLLNMLPI